MFGLGMWEVAVLFLVALLVLGPEKLPKVARKLGRGLREIRRAASELQANLAEADQEVRSYTSDTTLEASQKIREEISPDKAQIPHPHKVEGPEEH